MPASPRPWLLYGANGYSGELIARAAAARGERPVLAGRRREAIEPLAAELGLPWRVFAAESPSQVLPHLREVPAVLHCAGPFFFTYHAVAEACLAAGVHYADITGELRVLEALASRDRAARRAGVTLLPGAGFDVVPSDCLAAHLKRRLPTATHLALGFEALGRPSRGTLRTALLDLPRGGLVRRAGHLVPVPIAWRRRRIDFGRGERWAVTIPWGDLATAWVSTGIPNLETYLALSPRRIRSLRALRSFAGLLRRPALRRWLERRVLGDGRGPSAEERARGRSLLWGEASDGSGARCVARLRAPEGYDLTVEAALAVVARLSEGSVAPGYQTPATAFGADFALELAGVERYEG